MTKPSKKAILTILASLKTSQDIANTFGVTTRRVRAIVQRINNSGQSVGWQVPNTKQWLFLPSEIELLRPGKIGRPKKG